MSDDIFGNEARKFWTRNLSVIPLKGKEPVQKGWTGNLSGIPSEEKQRELLAAYPSNNIGMLLGGPFGHGEILAALDVDDNRLLKLTLQLLGLNRAERRALSGKRGKKGATIFARAPKSLKSTVIKGAGGLGNIDFLAAGRMTVMPPSIHPDTGKPYEVVGTSLLEVDFADLPEVTDRHIKLLKATIGSEHAITLIEGKATHDAGVALVALLVRLGATDEEISDIIVGLLPDGYAGDSLKELPEWIKSARDKGFATTDDDGGEETQSAKLVALALAEGIFLFRDEANKDVAMVTLPHTGPAIAYRAISGTVKLWLRSTAYKAWGKPVASHPLTEAIGTMEAIGLFDKPALPIFARIAGDAGSVAVDLGTEDGRVVQITPFGWSVETATVHKFIRGAGFRSLPVPEIGGDSLRRFQTFLGLDDQNYRLLLAFLISALRPDGPYFILLVEGEQGSGKSFFCEIIKRIIDPNDAMRVRLPDKPQDLMIQAKEYRLLSFDNASGMSAEMSDALCSLATGGGFAVRKLYTDADLNVMTYTRPFMINGIGGYASRPDLMERAIPIRLSPMAEGSRKTEAELRAEFEQILPGLLGALYNGVAHALREYDNIEPPRHLRMADAARWIKSAEEGLGEKPGAIIDAIAIAQNEFVVERVNDDALVLALRTIIGPLGFEGHIGDLFVKIIGLDDAKHQRSLPKTPSQLSGQLKRLRPAMAKAGIKVEFVGRDRKGSKVSIRFAEPDDEQGAPPF